LYREAISGELPRRSLRGRTRIVEPLHTRWIPDRVCRLQRWEAFGRSGAFLDRVGSGSNQAGRLRAAGRGGCCPGRITAGVGRWGGRDFSHFPSKMGPWGREGFPFFFFL